MRGWGPRHVAAGTQLYHQAGACGKLNEKRINSYYTHNTQLSCSIIMAQGRHSNNKAYHTAAPVLMLSVSQHT